MDISEKVAKNFISQDFPSSLDEMEKDEQNFVTLSFKARSDCIYSFIELLQHCKSIGGAGHSFSIVLDPIDSQYRNTVYFDGDGSDYVDEIKVNNKEVTRDMLDFDNR